MTSVLEALKSAQFVVNADGQKVAVQLSSTVWQALLTWLETAESIPSLEELLATTVVSRIGTTQSDRALVNATTQHAETAFVNVWNNSEDDIYNEL